MPYPFDSDLPPNIEEGTRRSEYSGSGRSLDPATGQDAPGQGATQRTPEDPDPFFDDVGKRRLWWNMAFVGLKIYVDDGMSEGPTFHSCIIHPQPAWGHKKTEDIPDQTVGLGVTKFYAKATLSQSTVSMGCQQTIVGGGCIVGYRFGLEEVELWKEVGEDQPEDEKLTKYKLLGEVHVTDDGDGPQITEYWWRVNHIFNWTYYGWTVIQNAADQSSCISLPPDIVTPPE